MLLYDIGRVLNGVARLLVGSGLFKDMRRENVPQVMRTMRQQALDRASPGVGVINSIALDDGPPSLVECGGVVGGIKEDRERITMESDRAGSAGPDTSLMTGSSLTIDGGWRL